MSLRSKMLERLPPYRERDQMIEPDQTTRDIVKEVINAHKEFAGHYDTIADLWMTGQLNKVPKKLFDFCSNSLTYVEEPKEDQTTRSPAGILEMRAVDCKHYSGFMAGVMDAINRTGEYYYDWYYRFASEDILQSSPHHVFIVLKTADEKEVWLDPVPNVGGYNARPFYFWKYDKKPKGMLRRLSGTGQRGFVSHTTVSRDSLPMVTTARAIGKVNHVQPLAGYRQAGQIGANQDAEKQLQDALKAYEMGLISSVANLVNKKQVDGNIDTIIKAAAASSVPGAAAALAFTSQLTNAVSNLFGGGSVLARVAQAASGGNVLTTPLRIFKAVFGGRNYYLDKYWLYNDYTWHVLGYSSGDSDHVTDDQVPIAGQWFITKLGVFISSRTILGALWDGEDNYMALHAGNPWITMDRVRVSLARQVMLRYGMNPHSPGVAGAWKNVQGVYDNQVTAAIEKARISDPNAATDSSGVINTGLTNTGVSNLWATMKANPVLSILIGGALAYGGYRLLKE